MWNTLKRVNPQGVILENPAASGLV